MMYYFSFFFSSDSYFSKCLPRRLNKCLWGKVNLGQRASRWTEGRAECVGVNCGLSSPTPRFQFSAKVFGLSPFLFLSLEHLSRATLNTVLHTGALFLNQTRRRLCFARETKVLGYSCQPEWLRSFFPSWDLCFNKITLSTGDYES